MGWIIVTICFISSGREKSSFVNTSIRAAGKVLRFPTEPLISTRDSFKLARLHNPCPDQMMLLSTSCPTLTATKGLWDWFEWVWGWVGVSVDPPGGQRLSPWTDILFTFLSLLFWVLIGCKQRLLNTVLWKRSTTSLIEN